MIRSLYTFLILSFYSLIASVASAADLISVNDWGSGFVPVPVNL